MHDISLWIIITFWFVRSTTWGLFLLVLITSQCKSSGNSAQDRKWKSKEEGVVRLGVKLVSTTETLMAIHISGGSFEVQEMKEGTFFLSLALFLAFSLLSLSSGLVPCERSDARFLRSRGAVRFEALKCTVRPIAWDESRGLRPFSSRTLKLAPNLTPATRFHKLKQAWGHEL